MKDRYDLITGVKDFRRKVEEWEEENFDCYSPYGFCKARGKYVDYLINGSLEKGVENEKGI